MGRLKYPAFVILVLIAFSALLQAAPAKSAAKGTVKVGFLVSDLRHERWQTDIDQFTNRAIELHATVMTRDAQSDADIQFAQAKELLEKGARVLVVNPVDGDKAGAIVALAHKHKVPVIAYDRLIMGHRPDFFVSYNNERIGELQAEYLLKLAPQGNYVLLEGSSTDNNATIYHEAHMKVLKAATDSGKITIVAEQWVKDWSETEAYMQMMKALQVTRNIQAVVAANDDTASGATQALLDAKVSPMPVISGQDSDLSAVVRIIKGTQSMSIYKPLAPLARLAADAAIELAQGKKPAAQTKINNGTVDVPAVLLEPKAVDRSNLMQTVFADHFQSPAIVQKELTQKEWDAFATETTGTSGGSR
ncbi:MAG TPA: substrate-binding domain-containing protein [Terriglobales bacterium]|nr:substrate-binding domain-containing protein [Terriglobales bacterium]